MIRFNQCIYVVASSFLLSRHSTFLCHQSTVIAAFLAGKLHQSDRLRPSPMNLRLMRILGFLSNLFFK
ncbi:hypothetical protein HAX54_026503, partial [Datura stramonium]|nr:hypothetical protein [Datura stramonium]